MILAADNDPDSLRTLVGPQRASLFTHLQKHASRRLFPQPCSQRIGADGSHTGKKQSLVIDGEVGGNDNLFGTDTAFLCDHFTGFSFVDRDDAGLLKEETSIP